MKAISAKHNTYIKRDWGDEYIISIDDDREYVFMNQQDSDSYREMNKVSETSIIWMHDDFVYCDEHGKEISADAKQTKHKPKQKIESVQAKKALSELDIVRRTLASSNESNPLLRLRAL